MRLSAIAVAFIFLFASFATAAILDAPAGNYSRKITINSDYIDDNLVNFPVLVRLASDSHLASNAQPDGDDISFWGLDNATQYNHEIEHYDSSTGELFAWVKVPMVYAGVNTELWLNYGNSDCDNQENPEDVWDSDYIGVWHMTETDTVDSTVNNNDGIPIGGVSSVTGRIHNANRFDGVSGKIEVPHQPSQIIADIGSWSYWTRISTHGPPAQCFISKRDKHDVNDAWSMGIDFGFRPPDINDEITFEYSIINNGTYNWGMGYNRTAIPLDTWAYIVFVYDSGDTDRNIRMYVNGQEAEPLLVENQNQSLYPSTSSIYIGAVNNGTAGFLNGMMDEVRFSSVVRSASWFKASYRNIDTTDFTVLEGPLNIPPVLSNPIPANGSMDVPVSISSLGVTIVDPEGESFDYLIQTMPAIGMCSVSSVDDGAKSCSVAGLGHSTTYSWSVNAFDGNSWTNKTFQFTTEEEAVFTFAPSVTLFSPDSGTSTTNTLPVFSYWVSDTDNDTVNCTLYLGDSPVASAISTADGSTLNSITPPSPLAYANHNWYVLCSDGNTTDTSTTWSLTVYDDPSNGGTENDTIPGFNKTFIPPAWSAIQYEEFINSNKNLQEALKNAGGAQTLSAEFTAKTAQATSESAPLFILTTLVEHTVSGGSRLTLTVNYSGKEQLEGAVTVFSVPKLFSTNSDDIAVTSPSIQGESMTVLESDPLYSIALGQVTEGDIWEIFFDVQPRVDRETVDQNISAPTLLVHGLPEQSPLLEPICGNGVKESGEECDGSDGVPDGDYWCSFDCTLQFPEPSESYNRLDQMIETWAKSDTLLLVGAIVLIIIIIIGFILYSRKSREESDKTTDEGEVGEHKDPAPPPKPEEAEDMEQLEKPSVPILDDVDIEEEIEELTKQKKT